MRRLSVCIGRLKHNAWESSPTDARTAATYTRNESSVAIGTARRAKAPRPRLGLASRTTIEIQLGSTEPEKVRCNGVGNISKLGPVTKRIGELNKTRNNPFAPHPTRRVHRSHARPLGFWDMGLKCWLLLPAVLHHQIELLRPASLSQGRNI